MNNLLEFFLCFITGAIIFFFIPKSFNKKSDDTVKKKIEELIKENEELLKKIKKGKGE